MAEGVPCPATGPPDAPHTCIGSPVATECHGRGCQIAQIIPYLNVSIEGKVGLDLTRLNFIFATAGLGTVLAMMAQPALAARFGKVGTVVLVHGYDDYVDADTGGRARFIMRPDPSRTEGS